MQKGCNAKLSLQMSSINVFYLYILHVYHISPSQMEYQLLSQLDLLEYLDHPNQYLQLYQPKMMLMKTIKFILVNK